MRARRAAASSNPAWLQGVQAQFSRASRAVARTSWVRRGMRGGCAHVGIPCAAQQGVGRDGAFWKFNQRTADLDPASGRHGGFFSTSDFHLDSHTFGASQNFFGLRFFSASTFPLTSCPFFGLRSFFGLPPLFGLCSKPAAEEEEVTACCCPLACGSSEFLSFLSCEAWCWQCTGLRRPLAPV